MSVFKGIRNRLCSGCIVLCLFRPKIITVYYNGICRRPEDFAMYALLIFALFVWKIYGLIDNDASYLQWIGYGMGQRQHYILYLDQAE